MTMTHAEVAAIYLGGFFPVLIGALLAFVWAARKIDGDIGEAITGAVQLAALWPVVVLAFVLAAALIALRRFAGWVL